MNVGIVNTCVISIIQYKIFLRHKKKFEKLDLQLSSQKKKNVGGELFMA
jgi:hypothetical protein